MRSKTDLEKAKHRALSFRVGLFLLAVYLFTYRGGFHSVDEVSMLAVTESLVKFGRFDTDQIAWTQWTTSAAEAQGFFGQDGHVYSKKGLALSLAQAPLYWLALRWPGLGMLQTVSMLNAVVTAATGFLIVMYSCRLGFHHLTSLGVALTFGLATIAFVYAKYLFSEPLAGFLLLLAAYMLLAYRQEGGLRHLAIAGLAAGLAVLTRANNLFLLPVFGLYLVWILANQRVNEAASKSINHPVTISPRHVASFTNLLPILTFCLAVGLVGAILMGYNALRSGHPFQTGYDLTLFSPHIWLGLYKLLLSPLRGFFVYSPILLLSVPGWWFLQRRRPAEAWLLAGLAGVTIGLFSAWSSGEGLSWGSRFLVPIVPFFMICLAPLFELVIPGKAVPHVGHYVLRFTFYVLLPLSLFIQILGVVINPWVFLAQIQTEFGGEFFLENTAALYDFRYSQIVGQLSAWSGSNSDLAWWQPGGFDGPAFGLGLALVCLLGWQLWREWWHIERSTFNLQPSTLLMLLSYGSALVVAYILLGRYYSTDRQFGPPDDPYSQALNQVVAQAAPGDQIVTVASYHYHVPMNRFKAPLPITGMAQQSWPLPPTAAGLLAQTATGANTWLVTVGFAPAEPTNATERWLTEHAFFTGSQWFDDVRLVRFGVQAPTTTQTINIILGDEIRLVEVKLARSIQPGQALPVELVWNPLKPPAADYQLFLQLLSVDGRLVAQHDAPPNAGYTPTSTWSPGKSVSTRHALALPPDLPRGDYHLIAGLYHPGTGQRLVVAGSEGFVSLGTIVVEPAGF
jgi:hypothetical protein